MLTLILGIGGVIQGNSAENPDAENAVRVPVPEEEQIYLFFTVKRNWRGVEITWFILMNGAGNLVLPRDEAERADFVRRAKCSPLPLRLFNKLASERDCLRMRDAYNYSKAIIQERINREKSRLDGKAPYIALMPWGWTSGDPFTIVNSKNGKFYPSVPDGMDIRAAYPVKVSRTLYEILTEDPVFVPTFWDMAATGWEVVKTGATVFLIAAFLSAFTGAF